MKRILGLFAASALLLSACGGGVQSPDFKGTLMGIDIIYTAPTGSATAKVAPGSTFQFTAVGLYSTPPGTTTGGTQPLVSCSTPGNPTAVCTTGTVSGVSWSVDPTASTMGPNASIDANGLSTGLRRGTATIRAKAQGFETTEQLIVDGAVLTSFVITATPGNSVPTGRSITLTTTPKCSNASGDTPCLRTDYSYSWSLPTTLPQDTVEFSPVSATGRNIVIKTKRFGLFSIDATINNEEGTPVVTSIQLEATERVLDDIIISADPAQSAPVPVIIGTQTRFVAKGVFSDGAIADIAARDLKSALVWTQDSAAVGKITIDNATGASPNTAVLVSGDTVGMTGLTATSSNTETNIPGKPNGLELVDRIGLDVKTFGLIGLVDICPFNSVGNECLQNVQLPLNSTTKFKARGKFQDNPNVARDIDPTKIPLTWSKTVTATTGDVTVVTDGATPPVTTGEFIATKGGVVTLNVALTSSTFEPAANPRNVSTGVTVIEPICKEQFFASNGTTSSVSSSEATNAGNVIDTSPDTFGAIRLSPGLLASDEFMSFQRTSTLVTPPVTTGQSLGFVIAFDEDVFSPDSLATIQTLDDQGAVVQDLDASSSQLVGVPARDNGNDTLYAVKATATMPFTGARLTVSAPDPEVAVPIPVVGDLLALLLGGGSTNVHVYAVCSAFNN